jgi:iron complex outermembrane recepter protein
VGLSLRYDEDERENTTLTEPLFDPTGLGLVPGTVRKETWSAWQPKLTLTYKPTDTVTVYGGYSRGFRSGGFNQTGVGEAVPEPGVEDLFDEQIADTYEVGVKASLWDGRLRTSLSAYYTDFEGAYFFFFDPNTSTQNLGSIDEVTYSGLRVRGQRAAHGPPERNFGFGYTDSEIEKAADPDHEGNQAPLVSEYTLNSGCATSAAGIFRRRARHRPRRLPAHRRHLVGARQHFQAQPHRPGGRARRHRHARRLGAHACG